MESRVLVRVCLRFLSALALVACAAPNADAAAPVGAYPIDAAVDAIASRVYVANRDDDTVSVVDAARLSSSSVAVGDEPVAVAVDPVAGVAWVASDAGASVTRITGSDLSTTPVALAAGAIRIAVHPGTGHAWVVTDAGTLVRIDGALATQTASVPGASFLAVDWIADRVWVAGTPLAYVDGDDLEVHPVAEVPAPGGIAIDPVADLVCASRPNLDQIALLSGVAFDQNVSVGDRPEIVAIDPGAGRIYAVNRTDQSVTLVESDLSTSTAVIGAAVGATAVNPTTGHLHVLEPEAGAVAIVAGTTVVHHPTALFTTSAALNPVTNRLYVVSAADASIDAIDTSVLGSSQIAAGERPSAVAVDLLRQRVFVANSGSDDVSVVDGQSQALIETVVVGDLPVAVAVDEARGIAWVANADSDDVTAIVQGPSGFTTETIAVGGRPVAIAANPATGAVFVVANESDSVTRITASGGGWATQSVAVGDGPVALAVDANANRVFVVSPAGGSVTRIDGDTLATQTFPVAGNPARVVVDATDGVAYVASPGATAITAIDGDSTAPIGEVVGAASLAVDPLLRRVYAANALADDVSVIDLDTGDTRRVQVGAAPIAVVLDRVANRILAVRSEAMTVIDGVSLTASPPIPAPSIGPCAGVPFFPVFDPVALRIYVPSCPGGAVVVLAEERQPNPLTVAIAGDTGATENATPTLEFTATNGFLPNTPAVTGIYYQVDTWMGAWTRVTPGGASGSATIALTPGRHTVYAFAVDGHEASSSASPAWAPYYGDVAVAPVVVAQAPEPAAALLGAAAIAVLALRSRRV